MQILIGFLYVLEIFVCFLLGGVILLQKPKEGGLGVSFDSLACEAGISPSLFIIRFKQLTGLPPHHFQLACRLEKAKRLLAETDTPISQLALALGFWASQHFSSHFKRAYGITPNA